MNKATLYCPVEISGLWGRIAPKINVTIPQSVLFAVAKGAAKKAVREELKRHDAQLAQSNTTPTSAPDMCSIIGQALPPDSVKMSSDVLFNLIKRRVSFDILDGITERMESGEISTLPDVLSYLKSMTE